MLRNRATFGAYQPKSWAGGSKKGVPSGPPIFGYYSAVIDESMFHVQVARQRHLTSGRGSKGNNFANIFTGLTTCAYCASPVRFHSKNDSKSLICSQVLGGTGCIRAAWSYKNFENSVLFFLAHPALTECLDEDKQKAMAELIDRIKQLSGSNDYDVRLEIASLLKQVVSELKFANSGSQPMRTLPGALIRRDNPERLFEIKLWDGPKFIGIPIP